MRKSIRHYACMLNRESNLFSRFVEFIKRVNKRDEMLRFVGLINSILLDSIYHMTLKLLLDCD